MRKKILILLMAVAFAAASLLMPATASANVLFPMCHNGAVLFVDASAGQAHLNHGDFVILEGVSCP